MHQCTGDEDIPARLINRAVRSLPADERQSFIDRNAVGPYGLVGRHFNRRGVDFEIAIVETLLRGVVAANARQIADLARGAPPYGVELENAVFIHMGRAHSGSEIEGFQSAILVPIPADEIFLNGGGHQLVFDPAAFCKALLRIRGGFVDVEIEFREELRRFPLTVEVHVAGNSGIFVRHIFGAGREIRIGVPSCKAIIRLAHTGLNGFKKVGILVVNPVAVQIGFSLRGRTIGIIVSNNGQRLGVAIVEQYLAIIAIASKPSRATMIDPVWEYNIKLLLHCPADGSNVQVRKLVRGDNLQTGSIHEGAAAAAILHLIAPAAPGVTHEQLIAAHLYDRAAIAGAAPANAAVRVAPGQRLQRRQPSKAQAGQILGPGGSAAAASADAALQKALPNDDLRAAIASAAPQRAARLAPKTGQASKAASLADRPAAM